MTDNPSHTPTNGASHSNGANGSTITNAELEARRLKLQEDMVANHRALIENAYLFRTDFLKSMMDPRKNIDDECGYPPTPTIETYRRLYDRNPIAARVVEVLPRETWQVQPKVYEDDDNEVSTPFEEKWDAIDTHLGGSDSNYFKDPNSCMVWEYLKRADEMSGVGTFSVILFGLDDGMQLYQPAIGAPKDGNPRDISSVSLAQGPPMQPYQASGGVRTVTGGIGPSGVAGASDTGPHGGGDIYGPNPNLQPVSPIGTDAQYFGVQFSPGSPARMPGGTSSEPDPEPTSKSKGGKPGADTEEATGPDLTFLRVYDEALVQIVQYEVDMRNPRYGQPIMYLITLNDPRIPHSGIGLVQATVRVHWSRVLHVADNLRSSEIFGTPRMQPVLNRLLDLDKLYGGSGEMYWRGAFPGISLETNPQLGGDVNVDKPAIQDMMENYMNGLQRFIVAMGMTAKTLAPQVVDPSPHIDKYIEAICIKIGCPVRVFKGSERGELASSQDDASWNDRIRHRQLMYVGPRIIAPFVNRLIMLGVLPKPKQYYLEWPDLDSQTDAGKAAVAVQKTTALSTYVASNVESVMQPLDFLVEIMGMPLDKAKAITDSAKQAEEEMQQQHRDLADEQGFEPAPPSGFTKPKPPPPNGFGQPDAPQKDPEDMVDTANK